MFITQPTLQDLNAFYNFRKKLKEETTWVESKSKQWCKTIIEHYQNKADKKFFLLKDDEKIIGQLLVKIVDSTGVINFIAIDVDYHGTGASKMLLDAGISFVKVHGVKTVQLFVIRENARAINFYKKNGLNIKNLIK